MSPLGLQCHEGTEQIYGFYSDILEIGKIIYMDELKKFQIVQ